jgi:ion channel-forming bestrophin family protein
MLLAQNIRLSRMIRNTWQVDIIMIITSTLAFLLHDNLLKYHFEIPGIVPTLLGTAIAFFIGFNNNQAYDRWWEGRKIWGALVNDSRSWARAVLQYTVSGGTHVSDLPQVQRRMICRHIAFLYALKASLRGAAAADDTGFKTYLSEDDEKRIHHHTNKQNALLELQSQELQQLSEQGVIDGFRFLQLDNLLVRFTDSMGMAERIKNTVFPTTYNYLTKVFIWLFVVSISLVISPVMGWWSIFMSWLVGFVFVSTQINGMNLVNPFENNSASLPLNQITRTIEINLLQMLNEPADTIPAPVTPTNNEYVL